ncbi:MAG TPA: ABC transporter permease [Puia sp.]|nr:ABC transporter permease [Puia sp.]
MFKNYFKIAFRNLWKHKSEAIINITGLSVGMAAAILILLWVQNELGFDSYHSNANRIYRITFSNKDKSQKWDGSPFPFANAAKQEIPGIENISKFLVPTWTNPVLNIGDELYKEDRAVFADSNWFNIFHYDYIEGNAVAFNQNQNSIILTQSLAKKYFGNRAAVGQIIRIANIHYQVSAVVKDNPSNSSFQFNIFLPLEVHLSNMETKKNESSWNSFAWQTFAVLDQKAKPETISKQLTELLRRKRNDKETDIFVSFTALKEMHFETGIPDITIQHGDKKVVFLFTLLGSLLLLIACINYVNLSTARASLRTKEVSIKKIIGADRKSLFKQFMTESLLTSILALLVTLLIIQVSLPFFNRFIDKNLIFSFSSLHIWELLAGTLLSTILLTGIYPAILLSSFKPLNTLRGFSVLKVKNTTLRKTLVVSQFAIAIALTISAIVIFKQLNFIQQNNEGYNRSQVFSVSIPLTWLSSHGSTNKEQFNNILKQELLAGTSIEQATFTSGSIINTQLSMSGIVNWDGKGSDFDPLVFPLGVDVDFLKTFQLQLIEGRWFQAGNTADKHNYILNETAVTTLGIRKPYVGQWFALNGDTGRVIGLLKDFHIRSYHDKIGSVVVINNAQWANRLFIKTAPFKTSEALNKAKAIWKTFFPDNPFQYDFLDEEFAHLYRADLRTSALIGLFAMIAIFISGLGLYGLASFTAEQRTKEIGIRKVLGATVTNITTLLSKDFIKLVIFSFAIASPVAWWAMNKWLLDFAYRITISWWVFAVAGSGAILIALLTVSFQAIKAAITNPVKSLRTA